MTRRWIEKRIQRYCYYKDSHAGGLDHCHFDCDVAFPLSNCKALPVHCSARPGVTAAPPPARAVPMQCLSICVLS